MLKQLKIEHVALIDSAEVSMTPGFNVLTGETGAGKSLIVESINMVTGERTSHDCIPTGEKKSAVQALFEVSEPAVLRALSEEGIEADDHEILLFRELYADGRNVCRINGQISTVSQLRRVGALLLNIHGQQDGQALLNKDKHLYFLDRFAEDEISERKSAYQSVFAEFSEKSRQLAELSRVDESKSQRAELLKFQIDEIERFAPWDVDEDALRNEQSVLKNAVRLKKILRGAVSALSDSSEFSSVAELLSGVSKMMKEAAAVTGDLKALSEDADELMFRAEDLSASLSRYEDSVLIDAERLEEISEILDELAKLKRKYGASVAEITAYYDSAVKELADVDFSGERIQRLRDEVTLLESHLREEAALLTAIRRESARRLERAIMSELSDLNMSNVRFSVDIADKEFGKDGGDRVEFLLATVPSEPLKPMTKIASGGEMSRIMLAMKTVLSQGDYAQTLIFDEIDAGVSGRAATRIAEKMRNLSRNKQVLCITHLPQICAAADSHFSVHKDTGAYRTDVLLLDEEMRIEEIARLMGGEMSADAIRAGASELRNRYRNEK